MRELQDEVILVPAIRPLKKKREYLALGYQLELDSLETYPCRTKTLPKATENGRKFRELAALTGHCYVLSKSLFSKLGGFDEKLSRREQSLDLGFKAWLSGHRVLIDPSITIKVRSPQNKTDVTPRVLASRLRLAFKHFSPGGWRHWLREQKKKYSQLNGNYSQHLWTRAWHLFEKNRPTVMAEKRAFSVRKIADEI